MRYAPLVTSDAQQLPPWAVPPPGTRTDRDTIMLRSWEGYLLELLPMAWPDAKGLGGGQR